MLVEEHLRYVASGQSCVLIVNQLDALCEIVDTKTKRLNLLIRVVRQAATVRVRVLSCREFDSCHDAWFKRLDAKPLHLQLPAWEEVERLLAKHQNSVLADRRPAWLYH